MATLSRWDPFNEMQRLTDQMMRGWNGDRPSRGTFVPAVDIYEDDKAIYLKAELPGIKPEDIDIRVENNVLTLSGERKLEREENRDGYHRIESTYGAFARSFMLPETAKADEVDAEMHDGVLTIRIAKKPEVEPKRIQVKSQGETPKQVGTNKPSSSTATSNPSTTSNS